MRLYPAVFSHCFVLGFLGGGGGDGQEGEDERATNRLAGWLVVTMKDEIRITKLFFRRVTASDSSTTGLSCFCIGKYV